MSALKYITTIAITVADILTEIILTEQFLSNSVPFLTATIIKYTSPQITKTA